MFHLRDGFFFERVADGGVRIVYTRPGKRFRGSVTAETTVPENEWASVLAFVSAPGENIETWQTARRFHAGRYAAAPAAVPGTCKLPPEGWFCTLEAGHEGLTCPTWPVEG